MIRTVLIAVMNLYRSQLYTTCNYNPTLELKIFVYTRKTNATILRQLTLPLNFFQYSRLINWNPGPLGLNLPDRSGKPFPRPQKPTPKSANGHDAHGHRCVI